MKGRKEINVRYPADISLTGIGQHVSLPQEKKPDLASDVISFYGNLGLLHMRASFELGICTFDKRELSVNKLEQHRNSQEMLYAVDDDFIVVVCPANPSGGEPDESLIQALHVRRGEGLILDQGTWHWVPYPLRRSSYALVGFAKDTAERDMSFYDLKEEVHLKR